MTWKEFRIEREGRRGWEIVLPCFSDDEHPEDAERMNRFYGTAAERMAEAAKLETAADARRARYRCETRIDVLTEENDATARKGPPGTALPGKSGRGSFPGGAERACPAEKENAGGPGISGYCWIWNSPCRAGGRSTRPSNSSGGTGRCAPPGF